MGSFHWRALAAASMENEGILIRHQYLTLNRKHKHIRISFQIIWILILFSVSVQHAADIGTLLSAKQVSCTVVVTRLGQ